MTYDGKYDRVERDLRRMVELRDEETYVVADVIRDDLRDAGWRVAAGSHVHPLGVFTRWEGRFLHETIAVAGAIASRRNRLEKVA